MGKRTGASHKPKRYIGLDIHKYYVVLTGVNRMKEPIMPFIRLGWEEFAGWVGANLSRWDAVVMEMTTNTWEVYDALVGKVHSITVVHPPHVKLIVGTPVMNDRKASLILARELADNRLTGVWVPPREVRDMRQLIAERYNMVRLSTIARNRLHNVLHRHHLSKPPGSQPFHPKHKEFWMSLPVNGTEKVAVQVAWATVEFAESQKAMLEQAINAAAAQDDRVPLLVQLPGFGTLLSMTVLAAIGDVTRFPTAKKLVGYAGLGARVHASGLTHTTGGITKTGRRDLRAALVTAAQHAVKSNGHWKEQYERLGARIGKRKAVVAIARKLLIVVCMC